MLPKMSKNSNLGKAVKTDQTPNSILQNCGGKLFELLCCSLELLEEVFRFPRSEKILESVSGYDFENFRVNLLSFAPAKPFTKVLFSLRDRFARKPGLIGENQQNSRRGRPCADNIPSIQQYREKQRKSGKPLFLIFLDFSKTFESINRKSMFNVLRKAGVPETSVRAVSALYEDRTVIIRLGRCALNHFRTFVASYKRMRYLLCYS